MNKREALDALGLQDDASPEDIKKAYRRAAMQHHPDRGGDEAEFKRVKEAYEFLEAPPPGRGPSLNDIFEAMSRGMGGMGGAATTLYTSGVTISLREAYEGCTKTLNIPILNGQEETITFPPGVSPNSVVKRVQGTDARGQSIIIQFHPNIDVGTTRVIWPTSPEVMMYGTPPGDVYDTVEIGALTMMLGGFIDYNTIDGGTISLRVPAGMQAGKKLKVKERGYWRRPGDQTSRGDVYVQVIPKIQKLDELPVEELKVLQKAIKDSLSARKV